MTPRKPKRRCFRLRARRERLGMMQAEVAEICGWRWANYVSIVELVDSGSKDSFEGVALRIQKVRRVLLEIETRRRRRREELRADAERVAFQRSLWAALPDHPAARALKAAMLDRCLDLMHEGHGEECDAIAEFLPEADVERMFEQWEREVAQATAEWEARRQAPPIAAEAPGEAEQLVTTGGDDAGNL